MIVGRPRNGYILGLVILLCGLMNAAAALLDSRHWWTFALSVYFVAWGILMLLSARAKSRSAKAASAANALHIAP